MELIKKTASVWVFRLKNTITADGYSHDKKKLHPLPILRFYMSANKKNNKNSQCIPGLISWQQNINYYTKFKPKCITVDEFLSSLFFTVLLQFIELLSHLLCTALLRHNISLRLKSGLYPGHSITTYSLFQSFCCRFAAVLEIIVLLYYPFSTKL